MKKFLSIFLLIVFQFSFSQVFEGKLSTIQENGLHQIVISPQVRSASQNNMYALRIYDSKKNEVPFITFNELKKDSRFKKFDIISKNAIPNVSTSIVILNENASNLSTIILKIANTEIDKKYSISGSNDNSEWFGLVNNQTVYDLSESGKTFVEKQFSFPLNNYKYLKFDFVDKNSLPINVFEASIEASNLLSIDKVELQNFKQEIFTDKNFKKTNIKIIFNEPQVVDGINFSISSPNLYLRNARILVEKVKKHNNKQQKYWETINYFQLNSKLKNTFENQSFWAKEFLIEIENQDNPELKIDTISLFQNQESIISDLKPNEEYFVEVNPQFNIPSYDLSQMEISSENNYPKAEIINFVQKKNDDSKKEQKFWQTPIFMWICIIVAVLIIAFFAIGMIKDMNKEA